jgi:hypothetical protein
MGIFGGLKPDDWKHWGQFTTFKSNAPELLRRQLRAGQVIYCSPVVDPYQPAEESTELMPRILDELLARPPRIFVIQTRGPLILRDLDKLVALARLTALRVSFQLLPIGKKFARSRRCCRAILKSWRGWRWKLPSATSSAMRCMFARRSRTAQQHVRPRSPSANITTIRSGWIQIFRRKWRRALDG